MWKKKEKKKTSVELTKKQYEAVLRAILIADSVYGILEDVVSGKYKKYSAALEELEDLFLQKAEELDLGELVDVFEEKRIAHEDFFMNIMKDMDEFEEVSLWDNLVNKLSDRDLFQKFGEEKLRTMDEEEYAKEKFDAEESYHKEFDKHGLERLMIGEA